MLMILMVWDILKGNQFGTMLLGPLSQIHLSHKQYSSGLARFLFLLLDQTRFLLLGQNQFLLVGQNQFLLVGQNQFLLVHQFQLTGAPVSTGKQNRPTLVPASRLHSSSVASGWWQTTVRPMAHLPTPTSAYFQTYTPFGPHVYYNQMHYDGDGWATAVKPSAGCSWKSNRNKLYKVPKNNGGSYISTWPKFSDPQGRPKSGMAWVPLRN